MKIFISYAHQDKDNVGEIKRRLVNKHGFDVFVAHDDIAISSEWMSVIISELEACDVFIPYLTRRFAQSEWTDQETGFALARHVKVIPICVDVVPYGFVHLVQALQYKNPVDTCNKIIAAIIDTPALRAGALDNLIASFGNSISYDDAADKIDCLLDFVDKLSSRQKNEILQYAISNNQIHGGRRPRNRVNKLIERNQGDLDANLITRFRALTNTDI